MSEHRAYQLYAHITWHTWKRVGCVDSAAVGDIERALLGACRRCTVRVLRWAALADHVHLLVSFRPHTRPYRGLPMIVVDRRRLLQEK